MSRCFKWLVNRVLLESRAQLSPVYTFYLHKHVILLRIEAPNQLNPLGPAHLAK